MVHLPHGKGRFNSSDVWISWSLMGGDSEVVFWGSTRRFQKVQLALLALGVSVIQVASKAGACDMDGTRISKENAIDLCKNESTAGDWQKCLEKICDLLEVGALKDGVD